MAAPRLTSPDDGFWDTLVVLALSEEGLLTQSVEPAPEEPPADVAPPPINTPTLAGV